VTEVLTLLGTALLFLLCALLGSLWRFNYPPSWSTRSDLVPFVAPLCIKGLRLVTMQLPKKCSPIGPWLKRTSS
jgi:hypothetical protein